MPTPPKGEHGVVRVRNVRAEIDQAEDRLLEALATQRYPEASKFAVRLALEEAIVNAFHHGHRGLASDLPIEVSYDVTPAALTVAVTDQGPGYDPGVIPDPTLDENLEKTSGRGLMLIRAFMTRVTHEEGGRKLVMWYERPKA